MTQTMKTGFSTTWLIAATLLLAACSDDSNYDFEGSIAESQAQLAAVSAPQALFNPDPDAAVLPFPNSLFFTGSTDGLLNIPIDEGAEQTNANPRVAINQLDGFSTVEPIVTSVSESLDESTLILGQTIRVLEVTTQQGIAVTGVVGEIVDDTQMAVSEIDNQITLIPRVPLKSNTHYMVVLTSGITDQSGMPLTPSFVYGLLKGADELTDPALEQLRLATQSHLQVLNASGVNPDDVALTWVFKTQSIRESLQASKDLSSATSLQLLNANLTTASINEQLPGAADIWIGALDLPYYQTAPGEGITPADVLSGVWRTEDGNPTGAIGSSGAPDFKPEKTGDEKVPVLVTVPNANSAVSQMPAEGWPVTIFVHGISRNRADMLLIADAMANAGRALVAIDMPLHGVDPSSPLHADGNPLGSRERTFDLDLVINPDEGSTGPSVPGQDGIADPSGEHFDNLRDLANTRDNLRQSVADLFTLRESLAGASGEGLMLNSNDVSMLGISFGAMTGLIALSYDDRYSAATLAVPGGGIAQLLANSERFGPDLEAGLGAAGIEAGTAEYQQFLSAAQTILDAGDPINHAATLAASSSVPVHVIKVVGDNTIPNSVATAPLAGTDPLVEQLGTVQIDSTSTTGGLVVFTEGAHGSLLDPTASVEVTQEMQRQSVFFAATQGLQLPVDNNAEFIEKLP